MSKIVKSVVLFMLLTCIVPQTGWSMSPHAFLTNAHGKISDDLLWIMLVAFLVFFMQAGFALVETGFTRAKNLADMMMKNLMDLDIEKKLNLINNAILSVDIDISS